MSEKREKLAAEIEAALPHFTGTEEYHRLRYPWLRQDFLLTDGAKYLADTAGTIGGTAYWLIDIIASHQQNTQVATEGFQTWKLYVNHEQAGKPDPEQSLPAAVLDWKQRSRPNEALVTCEDGNEHILVAQELSFAAFALDEVSLYVTSDEFNGIVVMLPSEY
jgi:hypothetical protein